MEFINDTPYPALTFEGIDQLSQNFHTVVMRVSCTWDDNGLLYPCQNQDPLCMEDVIVDKKDLMSGVIEESDLCHYKPNCDVLVIGSAYTPSNKSTAKSFECNLTLQTPDKWLFDVPVPANKYLFANTHIKQTKGGKLVKGKELINKTLCILAPRTAFLEGKTLGGELNYSIKVGKLPKITSLHPHTSFGGYFYLEENNPKLKKLPKDSHIHPPIEAGTLNSTHNSLAYFSQNNHNPYGVGYLTADHINTNSADSIVLPVVHYSNHILTTDHLAQMSQDKLPNHVYDALTASFGVRAKTHPQRHQYLGEIDADYLQNKTPTPKNFNFAIWNCAYPDQQVTQLVGNEWITLTNLSSLDTKACHLDKNGNTVLRLYLPELLAYLATTSHEDGLDASEVPMKLDTVIIRPDEQKVHLVWRGIIAGAYNPNIVVLQTADRQITEETLSKHFTQKGTIIRPYEEKHK